MRILCGTEFHYSTFKELERKVIIDSILFPELLITIQGAFPIFRLHQTLASDCWKVITDRSAPSAVDQMDVFFQSRLGPYQRRYGSAADMAAAYRVTGPTRLFRNLMPSKQEHPSILFAYMRDFFEQIKPPCFQAPYDFSEHRSLLNALEAQVTDKLSKFASEYDQLNFSAESGSAVPLHFLIESRLYGAHSLGYQASLPEELLRYWDRLVDQLMSSIMKTDADLYKQLSVSTTGDRVLRHLMGERKGSLITLVESEPLDPLSLIHDLPEPASNLDQAIESRKELDERVISIRRNCLKFRSLVEKIHNCCLEGDARNAVDALDEWSSNNPNDYINRQLIDRLGDFASDRTARVVSSQIDARLQREVNQRQTIKNVSGYFADVRLTFSALTLLTSYLGLTGRLEQALALVPSITFIPAAAARLIRSSIKILPGFDIYAAFQKWPDSKSIHDERA